MVYDINVHRVVSHTFSLFLVLLSKRDILCSFLLKDHLQSLAPSLENQSLERMQVVDVQEQLVVEVVLCEEN
jgi:hypothetical protein